MRTQWPLILDGFCPFSADSLIHNPWNLPPKFSQIFTCCDWKIKHWIFCYKVSNLFIALVYLWWTVNWERDMWVYLDSWNLPVSQKFAFTLVFCNINLLLLKNKTVNILPWNGKLRDCDFFLKHPSLIPLSAVAEK